MATIIGSGLEGYLHRQARRRALNLVAEAKEEAQRTLDRANAEIEAMRLRIRAETERTIGDRRRRAVAQARLQAKLAVTVRAEATLVELWDQAAAGLQHCAGGGPEGRLELIARLAQDAAEQLGGGSLELVVDAADRPLLTPEFLETLAERLSGGDGGATHLSLSPEEAPIWGGVIVYRHDAKQLVDNSLDERLALVRRTMRDEVARLLSSDGDSEGQD